MASHLSFHLLFLTLFLEHVHHDIDITVQTEYYTGVRHAGLLPVSSGQTYEKILLPGLKKSW